MKLEPHALWIIGNNDRIARARELNDQACFVLAEGQLETDIGDDCRAAIRHGQSHEDWRYRRA